MYKVHKKWESGKSNLKRPLFIFVLMISGLWILLKAYSPEISEKETHSEKLLVCTLTHGDTLYDCLQRHGLSPSEILRLTSSLKTIFNPERCRPGDKFELLRTSDGEIISFKYYASPTEFYHIQKDEDGGYLASKEKIHLEKRIVGIQGRIEESLWEAMLDEGVSSELILDFADIFAWEIDFLTEPRREDTFKFIHELYLKEETPVKNGRILIAQYNGRQTNHTAIYFETSDGFKGYYDLKGNSLRRAFLRSPLNYTRISSYFSRRRFHPILRRYRPHLGIDYVAPLGTPVVSIGDGIVTFKGWKGGYGRYIKIRHPNGYSTAYGHLSRYARGIRKGQRVRQGQVIGYVGTSGLSTGPHLHFEVMRNGRFVNFLALRIPPARSIPQRDRERFNEVKRERLMALARYANEKRIVGGEEG
jgi:murein DD-endopeptidase MepM/ murein hydrolase activator NlpD